MLSDDDEDDEESELPGLNYPLDYVVDTWLDHRKHGKYPDSGSYNDQDPLWWEDMRTVTARFNKWLRLLQSQKGDGKDVIEELTKQGNGESWDNLIGK